MNRVLLQLWEESSNLDGIFTDGCSIHLTEDDRLNFISSLYESRGEEIPEKYDRVLGGEIPVFISDNLFNILSQKGTLKFSEVEFRNLIKFEDIIFNYATI